MRRGSIPSTCSLQSGCVVASGPTEKGDDHVYNDREKTDPGVSWPADVSQPYSLRKQAHAQTVPACDDRPTGTQKTRSAPLETLPLHDRRPGEPDWCRVRINRVRRPANGEAGPREACPLLVHGVLRQLRGALQAGDRTGPAHGIDGFLLNVGSWNANKGYVTSSERIYEAAKQLDTGFKLAMAPEYSVQPFYDNVCDMVLKFKDHPTSST